MNNQMVIADGTVKYNLNEAGMLIVGLAWVLALGSIVLASIIICGWRGAKQVAFDWWHWKVAFYCR